MSGDFNLVITKIREQQIADAAVRRLCEEELSQAIDELVRRFNDLDKLTKQGEYTYEAAFEMCRKQAQRCVGLKNRLFLVTVGDTDDL